MPRCPISDFSCRRALPLRPRSAPPNYENNHQYPSELASEVDKALVEVGKLTGRTFGDPANPLLVSVRSGARTSMLGMMDTVLNLGLNDETVKAVEAESGDARFAYDSYRRFIQMYSDVVLGVEHQSFEEILEAFKENNGYSLDTELTAEDWQTIIEHYKALVAEKLDEPFPQDSKDQLWGAIGAVFGSSMNACAKTYRWLHNIPAS